MQAYRFERTRYTGGEWIDEPLGAGEPIDFGYLDRVDREEKHPDDLLEIPVTFGGDYAGDSVTVANCRAFLDLYGERAGVHPVTGGYGGYGVVITRAAWRDAANEDIRETVKGLENYPLIDEEVHSEVEIEAEEAAWDWLAGDLKHALHKREGEDEPDDTYDAIEGLTLQDLQRITAVAMEETNTYFEHEMGNSAYLDLDRILPAIGPVTASSHEHVYSLPNERANQYMSTPADRGGICECGDILKEVPA